MKSQYFTTQEIANILNISLLSVIQAMDELNITPVAFRQLKTNKRYYYSQSQITIIQEYNKRKEIKKKEIDISYCTQSNCLILESQMNL